MTATVTKIDPANVQAMVQYLIQLNNDYWVVVKLDTPSGEFRNDEEEICIYPGDNNILGIWTLPGQ